MADSLETHCLYCSERFDDGDRTPRILHDSGSARQHISCTSCLQKIIREKKGLTCPECNTAIDSSIEELQARTMQNDDEVTHAKQLVDSFSNQRCSNCEDPAQFRCEECRFYFCHECRPGHVKNKSFSHHNVRELASLTVEEMDNFQAVSMCSEPGHGLPVDMYCPKCDLACCLRCQVHISHNYEKLAVVISKKAEIARKDGKSVLKKKDEITNQIQALEEKISSIQKKTINEEDSVRDTARAIKESVESQEKVLLDNLHKHNNELTNKLEQAVRKRKELLNDMYSVEIFLNHNKQLGDIEQLDLFKRIQTCSMELKEMAFTGDISLQQEASYFVPIKDVDWERFKMGYVYSSSSQEDVRMSLRGYPQTEHAKNDIRILAIGKKRSGRTTTSFALMEQETRPSSRVFIKQYKNKTFRLRRTAGIGPNRDLEKEKVDICEHIAPGPHILLFMIRNPDEDVSVISDYKDIFKDDVMKYVIVVFTGKRELDKKKTSVDSYVQSKKDGESQIGRLLTAIGGRYVTVNTDQRDSLDGFRETVFRLIWDTVEANTQRFLTIR